MDFMFDPMEYVYIAGENESNNKKLENDLIFIDK